MSNPARIFDVTEATFDHDVLSRSHTEPVVVDFWAPWCGPCRTLEPMLARLAEAAGSFLLARVNVDQNPNLAAQYGVRGLPTVKAFRAGLVVSEFTGLLPEARLREFLRKLAPTPADQALEKGHSLLTTRHWAAAEAAFREALEGPPAAGPAALGLLKALLAQGRGHEACALLDDFPRCDELVLAEALRPLAECLAEAEGADDPLDEDERDALYHQAARLVARGQWEAGLDGLLDVLRLDRRYRGGAPRKAMLGLFELMGESDPLTRQYRGELAGVLF